MKKNVLIIGASGFVGKALTLKLAQSGNLFLVSRNENFTYPRAETYYGDLSNKDFCRGIVKNIDTVFYLAGYKKNLKYHMQAPFEFVAGNVLPLVNFLEAAKNSQIKKIIYMSSTNAGLYNDGEKDGYVVGKYLNELLLKSFAQESEIETKIIRSAPVYGPGDSFDKDTANFIPAMIQKIFESQNEIEVWGSGQRKLQFIYISDLVSNILNLADSDRDFATVGNPEALTINEIVGKIIRLSGKNIKVRNDPSKPDKLTQLFEFDNGIAPATDMEEGLKLTLEFYKQHA